MKQWVIRGLVVIFVLGAVFTIYKLNDFPKEPLTSNQGQTYEKAVVTKILEDNLQEDGNRYGNQKVVVRYTSGEQKGKEAEAISPNGTLFGADCTKGMRVIVMVSVSGDTQIATIYSRDRTIAIVVFIGLFILTVCVIGGKKGMKSIIGLFLTFIFLVFVMFPLVYKGMSPTLAAIGACVLSTVTTMFLIGGMSKKTISSIVGTSMGVTVAGLAAMLFGKAAGISGYNVSDIETLNYVAQYCDIHVGELLFAGIIISALGAVMDVGMSISSTIEELYVNNPSMTRKQLFLSGIHVGKDMMGTMTNTLILAYVGGSLSVLLVNYAYQLTVNQYLNSYNMGIEIMQGIAGSFGVVLTVPITAFAAAYLIGRE